MLKYKCEACDFSTDIKCNYNRHISTQKHNINANILTSHILNRTPQPESLKSTGSKKDKEISAISANGKNYKCLTCDQHFKHKSSLVRHKTTRCKKNISVLESKCIDKDNQIKILKSQTLSESDKTYTNQDMIDMVKTHMNGEGNIDTILAELEQHNNYNSANNNNNANHSYNNTTNNIGSGNSNCNNNINNSIVVNSYGKENTEYITDKDMIKFCKTPKNMISKHLKKVHYDTEHPENHNIDMPNRRTGDIHIREDDGINRYEDFTAVDTIVNDSYNAVTEFFEDKETNDPKFIEDNMRKDEVKTYKKYVETIEDERDVHTVNDPTQQPTYTEAKTKCLCVMIEGKINIKEFEKAQKQVKIQTKQTRRITNKA